MVDQWTGFNTATDTGDGVHPNDAGDRKMADRWSPRSCGSSTASRPRRRRSPRPAPPSPSASPSRSVPPSPSRSVLPSDSVPPVPGCTATYRIVNQWPGGFQGEVTVRNSGTGDHRLDGAVHVTGGERITQAWSATVTQSGTAVTADNADWNGTLAPGATATFGFIGSGTPAPHR